MEKDTSSSTNQTTSAEALGSVRSELLAFPVRCSICYQRIWAGAVTLKEPAEAPEPQQSWTLCKLCHPAVQAQFDRSPLRTPIRLRVAVGLVAADRWPRSRRLAEDRGDRIWTAFLCWGFAGAMLLHLLIIVLLAQIAK